MQVLAWNWIRVKIPGFSYPVSSMINWDLHYFALVVGRLLRTKWSTLGGHSDHVTGYDVEKSRLVHNRVVSLFTGVFVSGYFRCMIRSCAQRGCENACWCEHFWIGALIFTIGSDVSYLGRELFSQAGIVLEWKSDFSWLDLSVSHLGCEFCLWSLDWWMHFRD